MSYRRHIRNLFFGFLEHMIVIVKACLFRPFNLSLFDSTLLVFFMSAVFVNLTEQANSMIPVFNEIKVEFSPSSYLQQVIIEGLS